VKKNWKLWTAAAIMLMLLVYMLALIAACNQRIGNLERYLADQETETKAWQKTAYVFAIRSCAESSSLSYIAERVASAKYRLCTFNRVNMNWV
jgi:hypothetical protein